MAVQVSAVVCSHNRVEYLRRAINSLVEQNFPIDQYEIIIVDNDSTDDTRNVVCVEFGNVQNLRYIHEPMMGLSHARNTGWQNAHGTYIAYLDDDGIASPQWLATILDVFTVIEPKACCIGGRIEPIWERPRPRWLAENLLPYLALIDYGDVARITDNSEFLYGANFAFPRQVLVAVEGFVAGFGRHGSNLLSNEDTIIQQQLRRRHCTIYYHPAILVHHHVHPSRLNKQWFTLRVYWQGISNAKALIYLDTPSALRRIWWLLFAVRQLIRSPKQLFALFTDSDDSHWFSAKCLTWSQLGYVSGLLALPSAHRT